MSITDHRNVRAHGDMEEGPVGEVTTTESWIRERVIHVLSIYPKLSNSMLQVGMGTSLSPKLWKPILSAMISEGVVNQTQVMSTTPDGRQQTYTVISLASKKNYNTL